MLNQGIEAFHSSNDVINRISQRGRRKLVARTYVLIDTEQLSTTQVEKGRERKGLLTMQGSGVSLRCYGSHNPKSQDAEIFEPYRYRALMDSSPENEHVAGGEVTCGGPVYVQ